MDKKIQLAPGEQQIIRHEPELGGHYLLVVPAQAHLILYSRLDCANEGTISYTIELLEAGARVELYGTQILRGQAQCTITVRQYHRHTHTSSKVVMKSVLFDQAKLAYDGIITIERQAPHSAASQHHKSLLMSSTTKVTSKPQLEIQAHQVQCKHGSAVAKLLDEHMFYMKSRGLSEKQAKDILVAAFL